MIAGKAPLVSLDLGPRNMASIDFFQLGHDDAGLPGTKLGHDLCKRVASDGFTGDSYKASDEKPTPADFIAQADGVHVAPGSVCGPVFHFPQPTFRRQ